MTDFSALLQPDLGQPARTITLLAKDQLEDWLAAQPEAVRALAAANRFDASPGDLLIIPAAHGGDWSVVAGSAKQAGVWSLAAIASRLPEGTYRLAEGAPGVAALGWLLAHYSFDRYRKRDEPMPQRVLLTSEPAEIGEMVQVAQAQAMVRDLVNTPAADLGPGALEAEAERIARQAGVRLDVTKGDALASGYPLIHAVGKAADREHAPRLIEFEWGDERHPRIAIIGKGVIFDSGGLDIKPSSGMRLMKKDMGGAAHALALARLVISAGLPVRMHVLVPAVENAISGNAMRPGDIVRSRKGLTVEIDNTDAEGRLILADAMTKAAESSPELMIDFATLTGAARVALGADLPAFFANDDALAADFAAAATEADDPLWRLPLWSGYEEMLKSDIADTANSGEGGFAGAITAALFLQKFVEGDTRWGHFDTWAWRASSKPGRSKGGEALGLRASWALLKRLYRG